MFQYKGAHYVKPDIVPGMVVLRANIAQSNNQKLIHTTGKNTIYRYRNTKARQIDNAGLFQV